MKDQTSSTKSMTSSNSLETFKDSNIITTTSSLENLRGHPHDHHQSLLLDDIDRYLPPPQPEPEPKPKPETVLPTPEHTLIHKIEYDFFREECGPTLIHTLPHEEAEIKNVHDKAIENSRGKQPILVESERRDDPHHKQDLLKKRSGKRRRRERVNVNIKAIQQLIPHCGKGNHAIILERAIEYIKSLKLHIHAFSRIRSEQGQFEAPYATQMMTRPWAPRMFHGIGSGPWLWGPQLTNQTGYPILGHGGFGGGVQIQPMSHGQVPFAPILYRPPFNTTPIMSPPTSVVLPFTPPQSQASPSSSFNQAPHF